MVLNVLLIAAAVSLTLLAAWAYSTAQRLHRLHIRLDRSRDALQAALDRRCAVVAAVYPELGVVAGETERTRLTPTDLQSRMQQEACLVQVLRERAGGREEPAPLQDANTRVSLALRFYNDAVEDTRALSSRPLVRALRLGGTAAPPQFVQADQ